MEPSFDFRRTDIAPRCRGRPRLHRHRLRQRRLGLADPGRRGGQAGSDDAGTGGARGCSCASPGRNVPAAPQALAVEPMTCPPDAFNSAGRPDRPGARRDPFARDDDRRHRCRRHMSSVTLSAGDTVCSVPDRRARRSAHLLEPSMVSRMTSAWPACWEVSARTCRTALGGPTSWRPARTTAPPAAGVTRRDRAG